MGDHHSERPSARAPGVDDRGDAPECLACDRARRFHSSDATPCICWATALAVREGAEPQIRYWARRRGVPAPEMEDLLQTVLHEAWIRVREIRHAQSPLRWLVVVGCATIKEWRGCEWMEIVEPRALGQHIDSTLGRDPMVKDVAATHASDLVRKWIGEAPKRHRSLLAAVFIKGKPLTAIAVELGATPEAVRMRLRRAVAAVDRAQPGRRR